MTVGRILRKMGLPLWTFIGVGVSVTWITYLGKLFEKVLNSAFDIEGASWSFKYFSTDLVLFFLPAIFVVALLVWHRNEGNRRRMGLLHEELPRPAGKKGLILLVSTPREGTPVANTHAMHAVVYHLQTKNALERVWLIPSDNSDRNRFGPSTRPAADDIKKGCETIALQLKKRIKVEIYEKGVSPADSQDTFDYVNRIFTRSGFKADAIIADFTGGTKPMTVGMIMACLPRDRELEYVPFNQATGQMDGPFVIEYQHSAFDLVG
jgi:CRISPR-associated protein (Cas_Cas02710)